MTRLACAMLLVGCGTVARPATAAEVSIVDATITAWIERGDLPMPDMDCIRPFVREAHVTSYKLCFVGYRDVRRGPEHVPVYFLAPGHEHGCLIHETLHQLERCSGLPYSHTDERIWHDAGPPTRTQAEREESVEGRARAATGGLK